MKKYEFISKNKGLTLFNNIHIQDTGINLTGENKDHDSGNKRIKERKVMKMEHVDISVNGEKQQLEAETSILQLLEERDVDPQVAVVKINDSIIENKEQMAETELKSGDEIEIIFFMGGGSFDLSEEEIERYSRHIILKELGGAGQQKIKDASILVAGTGGLGSPTAFYLAAAGVGKLGLVDSDVVDLSNLQRQILHSTPDVDRPKVDSAVEKLRALNPGVDIKTYHSYLNKENIFDIIADYDVVVDGVDNFPTRYLINDACVLTDTPLVEAGILRFQGQVMTILPGEGPCYRCVFREPPQEGAVPACREAGVLGAVAGTIGTLEATEALKLVTDIGEPLVGRLLIYDALKTSFREVNIEHDQECPLCGEEPEITELQEYELECELHDEGQGR